MKIGIDIDDTVGNTNELLIDLGIKFDKEYLRGEGLRDPNAYKFVDLFYWDEEDVEKFFLYFIKSEGYQMISPKEDAIKYIKKIHDMGVNITFITYRQSRNGMSSYDESKKWLDRYGFCYDKLISDSGDKGIVCERENIDLFIDDSVSQISDCNKHHIKTLLYNTIYNKYAKNYNRVSSWEEIYNIVRGMMDERGNL